MRLRSCFPLTSENLNKVDHQRCRERLGGKKSSTSRCIYIHFRLEEKTLHWQSPFTRTHSSYLQYVRVLLRSIWNCFHPRRPSPFSPSFSQTNARTHARTHTDIPWHLVLLMLDGGCHGNTSLTLFLVSLAEKTQKLTQEAEEVQGARIIRSNQWRPVEGTEVIPRLSGSSVLDCQKRDLGGCCCPVKPKVNCDSTHKVLIKHDLLPHPTKLRLFHVR